MAKSVLIISGIAILTFLTVGKPFVSGPRNSFFAPQNSPQAIKLTDQNWQTLSLKNAESVLILGESGPGWTAGDLTDTILVALINPDGQNAILVSIPRDLVVLGPKGEYEKINSLWTIGKNPSGKESVAEQASLIKQTAEKITGIPIFDVIIINVAAVKNLVDTLGGIAVNVEQKIDDPAFPTPGGGIEHFTLDPGFQVLNGDTAVKYIRTRHTPNGDFGRTRRQQQTIEAVIAKARGLNLLSSLPKLLPLYGELKNNMQTTIDLTKIPSIIKAVENIPFNNVETIALDESSPAPLLKSSNGILGAGLMPKAGMFDYTEIQNAIAQKIASL